METSTKLGGGTAVAYVIAAEDPVRKNSGYTSLEM
jgi:hypothetical protein